MFPKVSPTSYRQHPLSWPQVDHRLLDRAQLKEIMIENINVTKEKN